MTITLVGALLVPVGLVLALRPTPRALVLLLVFFAPFTATAVINFSNPPFGLQPAYFLGSLLILRLAWNVGRGYGLELEPLRLRVIAPLLLLLAVGVVSVALVPLYSPETLVTRPSGELEELAFTRENVTQLVYLAFVVLFTVTLGALRVGHEHLRLVLRIFVVSGVFVAIWGWLQVGLDAVGLPYPDPLFNNSVSYSQLFAQRLPALGIKRMTSVAPEPSMLARSLIVPLTITLASVAAGGTRVLGRTLSTVTGAFLALTMLMTTSSTGLLGLVVVLALLAGYASYTRPSDAWVSDLGRVLLIVIAVLAAATAVALSLLGITLEQLRIGVDVLLFGKIETVSGQGRIAGALAALELFATHPLLGVGWGSNRSFDLITNILSNLGLIGFGLLLWVHLAVLIPTIRRARRLRRTGHASGRQEAFVLQAACLALVALLGGKMLSEPHITYLDQWILLGVLTAALARRPGPDEEAP